MAAEIVECNQCGGAAIVKAVLPAEPTDKTDPAKPAAARVMIYCARCGMRSQPAANSGQGKSE